MRSSQLTKLTPVNGSNPIPTRTIKSLFGSQVNYMNIRKLRTQERAQKE
jgi:hypothetical protein